MNFSTLLFCTVLPLCGMDFCPTSSDDGQAALFGGCSQGELGVVKRALKSPRVDASELNQDGLTPMLCALYGVKSAKDAQQSEKCQQYIDVVHYLVRKKVSVFTPSNEGVTPLMVAGSLGNPDLLGSMLTRVSPFKDEHKASLNARCSSGKSALLYAVEAKSHACAHILRSCNAATGSKSPATGHDELMTALLHADMPLVELLLESPYHFGADHKSKTVFHHAAELNNPSVIEKLGCYKKDDACKHALNALDCEGYTPLHRAVMSNSLDSVQALAQMGAFLEPEDPYGLSPLHHAVEMSLVPIIDYFMHHKFLFTKGDKSGNTPFMNAVLHDNRDLILMYRNKPHIGLSTVNKDGDTALHLAVLAKNSNMLWCLVYYYAIHLGRLSYEEKQKRLKSLLSIKNKRGQSALDLAALPSYRACYDRLKELGLVD